MNRLPHASGNLQLPQEPEIKPLGPIAMILSPLSLHGSFLAKLACLLGREELQQPRCLYVVHISFTIQQYAHGPVFWDAVFHIGIHKTPLDRKTTLVGQPATHGSSAAFYRRSHPRTGEQATNKLLAPCNSGGRLTQIWPVVYP